jgi:hypothetical protein
MDASVTLRAFFKRHSLVIGIVLMFALTWPFYSALGLFVGYGLALASLIMTGLTEGRAGVHALLRGFLIWRVGVQWYLLILSAHHDVVPRRPQHGVRVLADCALRDWRCHTSHDMHRYRVCGRVRCSSGSWASAAFAPIAGLRLIAEGQAVLGEVHAWFTEGFDTLNLQEARELLEELAERQEHAIGVPGPQR